jgi:hypothetical protein
MVIALEVKYCYSAPLYLAHFSLCFRFGSLSFANQSVPSWTVAYIYMCEQAAT